MGNRSKDRQISIFLENDENGAEKRVHGWIELPIKQEAMEKILEKLTGTPTGKEYIISAYECPYFLIYEHEDAVVLNRVTDIIAHLDPDEQLILKGWCDAHEQGMADMTEIGNAALQIRKIEYLPGITETEQLGRYIAEKSGLTELVMNFTKEKLNLDVDCLNYEEIGVDFEINNPGYYIRDFDSKNGIKGYVLDDKSIDEFLYTTDELLKMNLEGTMTAGLSSIQEHKSGTKAESEKERIVPIKECMKRSANRMKSISDCSIGMGKPARLRKEEIRTW